MTFLFYLMNEDKLLDLFQFKNVHRNLRIKKLKQITLKMHNRSNVGNQVGTYLVPM